MERRKERKRDCVKDGKEDVLKEKKREERRGEMREEKGIKNGEVGENGKRRKEGKMSQVSVKCSRLFVD